MRAELMKQMVLKNQVILGSVNVSVGHFATAVKDLELSKNRWGDLIDLLTTSHIASQNFQEAIDIRSEDDIKTVIEWAKD